MSLLPCSFAALKMGSRSVHMSSVAGLIRLPCCSAQWWLEQMSLDKVQLVVCVVIAGLIWGVFWSGGQVSRT